MAAVPELVMRVVEYKGGGNPTFFAKKKLTKSDTIRRQNRLLFREDDVINRILPLLGEVERERANLLFGNHGMCGTKGLPVELYIINRWKFQVFLRRRNTKGFVLKGKDWKNTVVFGEFRAGDVVQLWSFKKHGDDSLCLIIVKI